MGEPVGCEFIEENLLECVFNPFKWLKRSTTTKSTRFIKLEGEKDKYVYDEKVWPNLKELYTPKGVYPCKAGVCIAVGSDESSDSTMSVTTSSDREALQTTPNSLNNITSSDSPTQILTTQIGHQTREFIHSIYFQVGLAVLILFIFILVIGVVVYRRRRQRRRQRRNLAERIQLFNVEYNSLPSFSDEEEEDIFAQNIETIPKETAGNPMNSASLPCPSTPSPTTSTPGGTPGIVPSIENIDFDTPMLQVSPIHFNETGETTIDPTAGIGSGNHCDTTESMEQEESD